MGSHIGDRQTYRRAKKQTGPRLRGAPPKGPPTHHGEKVYTEEATRAKYMEGETGREGSGGGVSTNQPELMAERGSEETLTDSNAVDKTPNQTSER